MRVELQDVSLSASDGQYMLISIEEATQLHALLTEKLRGITIVGFVPPCQGCKHMQSDRGECTSHQMWQDFSCFDKA